MSTTEWISKGKCALCKNEGVTIFTKDDPLCRVRYTSATACARLTVMCSCDQDCWNRRHALEEEVDGDVKMDQAATAVRLKDNNQEKQLAIKSGNKADADDEVDLVDDPAHPDVQRAVLWAVYRLWARFLLDRYMFAPQRPLRVSDEMNHIISHMDMPHVETHYHAARWDDGRDETEIEEFTYSRPGYAPFRKCDTAIYNAAVLAGHDIEYIARFARDNTDPVHAPYESAIWDAVTGVVAMCDRCGYSFAYCLCVAEPDEGVDVDAM